MVVLRFISFHALKQLVDTLIKQLRAYIKMLVTYKDHGNTPATELLCHGNMTEVSRRVPAVTVNTALSSLN